MLKLQAHCVRTLALTVSLTLRSACVLLIAVCCSGYVLVKEAYGSGSGRLGGDSASLTRIFSARELAAQVLPPNTVLSTALTV